MPTAQPAPEIEIRSATRDDLPQILELLAQDSLAPPATADLTDAKIRAFEQISADPCNQLIVATLDARVVATLQLTFIPGLSHNGRWRAHIEAVHVRNDVRGRRIGTRLMEWAIQRARERNCWLVQLTSNRVRADAHRFYERLGFTPSHVGMKLYLER